VRLCGSFKVSESFDFVELHKRFVEATDFGDFWNYFLDDFAEKPAFMRMGAPAETKEMEELVAMIASRMVGKDAKPEGMLLTKIPDFGVVHGACVFEGDLTCVLYFESLERGLVVLSKTSGKTHFARFTRQFSGRSQWVATPKETGGSGLPN
jgi:hypothetical protein